MQEVIEGKVHVSENPGPHTPGTPRLTNQVPCWRGCQGGPDGLIQLVKEEARGPGCSVQKHAHHPWRSVSTTGCGGPGTHDFVAV